MAAALKHDNETRAIARRCGFQIADVSVQDWPEPHGPVAGHPANRRPDLRPIFPQNVEVRRAVQRLKSKSYISIL
jgi:hypothetical protein